MRFQLIYEQVPLERPSGLADRPARWSGAMLVAPTLDAVDLESVHSVEENARAEQVVRMDLVSTARGEGPHHSAPSESATERSVRLLVYTQALRREQQEDPFLERARSYLLHGEVSTNLEEEPDTESYFLGHRNLPWHVPTGKGEPVLAVHPASVSGLMSLNYALDGQPGVVSTLALLHEGFHRPTMTQDVLEYVLSCGCR